MKVTVVPLACAGLLLAWAGAGCWRSAGDAAGDSGAIDAGTGGADAPSDSGSAGSGGRGPVDAADAPIDATDARNDASTSPDTVPPPGPSVLMRGYDLQRTGANLAEATLRPSVITPGGFGKLFCIGVDDEIYGQILYMSGVDLGARGRHDVIFVVTQNDSVYAFDASDAAGAPLWHVSYRDTAGTVVPVPSPGLSPVLCNPYRDISRQVGITSTPAIDPATMTMYLVARTLENGTSFVQRLHAISLIDGGERPGSPVAIQASAPGTGDGAAGGLVRFDPLRNNQRAALLLQDGLVYIAFSSHCDEAPYHGWLLGYDARTLSQVVAYTPTPNGRQGGIWMSGAAPAVGPDGSLYLLTGNGSADLDGVGGPNHSQAFLRLARQGNQLALLDWFTPANYDFLESQDRDLGSSGAVLIPGSNLLLGGNKDGVLYVLDRDNLGHFRATGNDQILQTVVVSDARSHIHGTPVYWRSMMGEFVYVMAEDDYLRQFRIVGGQLVPFRASQVSAPIDPRADGSYTMPGGILGLSAAGDQPDSGVLWVSLPIALDANHQVVPGVLRAFDAGDVTGELWNSEQLPARDSLGNLAKFNPPTVVNGKVYVPTFSNQLCVYGKLN